MDLCQPTTRIPNPPCELPVPRLPPTSLGSCRPLPFLLAVLCLPTPAHQSSFLARRLHVLTTLFPLSGRCESCQWVQRQPEKPQQAEWASLPRRGGQGCLRGYSLGGKAVMELTASYNPITSAAKKMGNKKKKATSELSVLYCKAQYRFINDEISCVKEHLRTGDLAYWCWLLFIFCSPEMMYNNFFNYLFNIVRYHNGSTFWGHSVFPT